MRFKRRDWGARRRKHHPGRLKSREVKGIALHWPAMDKPVRGICDVQEALRSWQNYHMDVRGWSDIAYQEAIDQDGHVYILRRQKMRSAANGNSYLNGRYGALLLIIANDEEPTPKMIRAVRRRIRRHRKLYPDSTEIVGHGQIRPGGTACPGPAVLNLIRKGAFTP